MKMLIKLCLISILVLFAIVSIVYTTYGPNKVIVSNGEYEYDISKKENITASAKQLFVGRVIEQLETETDDGGPYTPYKVIVENNLKGELGTNQEVIVEQRIGYDKSQKAIIKMEEEDSFLTQDSSYVFATSNITNHDRYRIIVPVKGNVKIKDKKEKHPNELILKEFKEALKKNNEKRKDEI
ncbi:hypothetical protein [Gottfriedia luciferensis]|uniref:hypothetical protein n=1 Tax=Gottfriedia luciferensis TaxID=178774 RepID=UPI000B445ADF|nr:hypothetical protein [Gottfriedia luciferensis]